MVKVKQLSENMLENYHYSPQTYLKNLSDHLIMILHLPLSPPNLSWQTHYLRLTEEGQLSEDKQKTLSILRALNC